MSDWFDTLKEAASKFKGLIAPKERRDYEPGLYVSDLWHAVKDPKGLIYSAMMDGNEYRSDVFGIVSPDPSHYEQIIRNKDKVVANRSKIPRNLASLYIYGNDLGQFHPLSAEQSKLGVEYNSYLKSIGRDPSKIVTYKGNIQTPVRLPNLVQNQLPALIKSSKLKTYGAEQIYDNTPKGSDDVAGHLLRLTMINNIPYVVNSDLWDFEPSSYAERYKDFNSLFGDSKDIRKQNRNRTYYQAKLLNMVGTPFILKDFRPVDFVDVDEYYEYPNGTPRIHSEAEQDIMRLLGWLPEVIVKAKKK